MSDADQPEGAAQQEPIISLDDGDNGNSIATLFSNRVFIQTGDPLSRLSFGEVLEGKTYWRAAITMSSDDMRAVGRLIRDLLGDITTDEAGGDDAKSA